MSRIDLVRVLLTSEGHFCLRSGGGIYADGPAKYSAWANYLEAFDEVVVLARVTADHRPYREEARADGPSVSFCALPDYHGPWEYLRNLRGLKSRERQAVESCDAYILRVPGLVSHLAWHEIRRLGKPYALEVVGDPWDALGPRAVRSVLRPIFRELATRELKAMCKGAMAVHYVTQKSLQGRYPPSKNACAVGFSDALMDFAFASLSEMEERSRRAEEVAGPSCQKSFRIGFVGSLAQMYKGPDVLLRAASLCRSRGLSVDTAIAGDGRYAVAMKALAKQLGIEDRTEFLGQLAFGKAVFDFLGSVDLFVMPSYAEGLPRALLEAMARGCPCIGSNVGGIPELLSRDDLIPPGDSDALAKKIIEVAENPERMRQMSLRNLEKAREFNPEALREIRQEFYRFVKQHSGNNGSA